MGQAKRRKQQLGGLYGTPEGSNNPFVVYQGYDQNELDKKAAASIANAQRRGQAVCLIGTEASRPLAAAAGLPWLHEIAEGQELPRSFAWDPEIAENGGPLIPGGHFNGGVTVLGAGFGQYLTYALTTPTPGDSE
jgi:hypothetical protein